jgi:hypothetical protein
MAMNRLILAIAAVAALCPAPEAAAADVKAPPVAAPVLVVPAQDCSAFYDDYAVRGFGWGSGPGSSLGFGAFEGALNRYPSDSFPNWYGACVTWGRYSASGRASRW